MEEGIYDWERDSPKEPVVPDDTFIEDSTAPLIPTELSTQSDSEMITPTVEFQRRNRVPKFVYDFLGIVVISAVLAGVYADIVRPIQKPPKAGSGLKGPTPSTTPSTSPTIAPSGIFSPEVTYDSCQVEPRTIAYGDTIFGLTTVGLSGNTNFMDTIFAWNLAYLKEQAKTNKALANPNNINIGEKLKILTNCVEIDQLWTYYNYQGYNSQPNFKPKEVFERQALYQTYLGKDGKTHPLVTVIYDSNSKGQLVRVQSCLPAPACYNYVNGAPSQPPK